MRELLITTSAPLLLLHLPTTPSLHSLDNKGEDTLVDLSTKEVCREDTCEYSRKCTAMLRDECHRTQHYYER